MAVKDIYIGNTKMQYSEKEVKGKLVVFEYEDYYKISHYDQMRPFFISVVSHSNHWLFISSNGGLSAGRQNSESALFPYYTDDKITEASEITGSKTILQIHTNDLIKIWEPFSNNCNGAYALERNLYKSQLGNKIVFEEINHDLGLIYRYHWNTSSTYGFIKKSTLINLFNETQKVKILDGIQNIMPYGVASSVQNASSNLVDAYKKNELEADIGLGIYALSAIIVDKAEPSEALKATTVWSTGIKNATYLISSSQLAAFKQGQEVKQEIDIRAEKGAYFSCCERLLQPQDEQHWLLAAEVNQSMSDLARIQKLLNSEQDLTTLIQEDIEKGSQALFELNAASDGIQVTADKLSNTRHFSNTLFNIMRGGIFDYNYSIEKADFIHYLKKANTSLYTEVHKTLEELSDTFSLDTLKASIKKEGNKNFKRLALEYLPLKFSRRHGDPSRPWNKFSINTETDDGKKVLDYQGNWRDIFQNWEALAYSYPFFIENIIHKFLNATTFDGYNPYRVTKDGFDWETIEPDDPWSYIGYWGDHQIIYLLKLLECSEKHFPNLLTGTINENRFVYANVPYKIKAYKDILENPKDTIVFDEELDLKINKDRTKIGADAALLKGDNTEIYYVSLLEKLLATVLSKISNYIPEGGIWMNTQRPEWNDANNALVGNGVSMVTLYYLKRFLSFLKNIINNTEADTFDISIEIKLFFNEIKNGLQQSIGILGNPFSNRDRKKVMDALGSAGSNYRNKIYNEGFSTKTDILTKQEILDWIVLTQQHLDHSIILNRRPDHLYHSYNLMTIENDHEVSISYLPEMLEGQVAVLSASSLSSKEALTLLDALKKSALFRHDQYSYTLYPDKQLSRFVGKNNIPPEKIESLELVQLLLKNENTNIIEKDVLGNFHFNGTFNNANSLKNALGALDANYQNLIEKDKDSILETFEDLFNHKAFTGRSGTFFGYEGLGSIYWHMVSKLLLSVQETCLEAIENNETPEIIGRLLEHFYEINEGIGVHKSPKLHGAFPTDPYSHTPAGKGAQQPGMTGQVKEDILSRFGELGVFVKDGSIHFNPWLLRKDEFLRKETIFKYVSIAQHNQSITLNEGSIGFTYCQVPIIYTIGNEQNITITFSNGTTKNIKANVIDKSISEKIFARTGEIQLIEATITHQF